MPAYPVFIVGSPRSGTSVLTAALLGAGYAGFYEGNFLSLIRAVDRVVDQHMRAFYTDNERVLTAWVDSVELKERLFAVVAAEAQRHAPSAPWLDKTGGHDMIDAIPALRRLFPGSRYIFARRRAIENIASRLIKFPDLSFEYHCVDWARTMAAWRRLRQSFPAADTMEVDQHDIARHPRGIAKDIGAFLELGAAAVETMTTIFSRQRPQQTSPGSAGKILSIAELGWSDEQKALFETHCGPQMRQFGYSLDDTYRRRPAA